MKPIKRNVLFILLTCWAAMASAQESFVVLVDTSELAGQQGHLAFDFIDGDGAVNNQVTLDGLEGDALFGSASVGGDVSGLPLPGPLLFGDAEFYNNALQPLEFGTWLEFELSATGASGPQPVPDTFAFYVLDADQLPVGSADPTGSGAQLILDLTDSGPAPVVHDSQLVTVELGGQVSIDSISADPDRLWPPNRKMVPVNVQVALESGAEAAELCFIDAVFSNEPPVDGDFELTDALSLELRAWREGSGDGRVYTIDVRCESGSAFDEASVEVLVPHDRGNGRAER